MKNKTYYKVLTTDRFSSSAALHNPLALKFPKNKWVKKPKGALPIFVCKDMETAEIHRSGDDYMIVPCEIKRWRKKRPQLMAAIWNGPQTITNKDFCEGIPHGVVFASSIKCLE